MAAHVLDNEPPPDQLRRALDYRGWNVNVMELTPGELPRSNVALNAYNALTAYRRAAASGRSKEFTEQNPEAWEFVSSILADRMRRARNG